MEMIPPPAPIQKDKVACKCALGGGSTSEACMWELLSSLCFLVVSYPLFVYVNCIDL